MQTVSPYFHPLTLSRNLRGRPLRAELAGKKLVAWRDALGTPRVMEDACPHRGAPLSNGTVSENCVTCPYHGWKINGTGHVAHMPADAATRPSRRAIQTYDAVEHAGILWAWAGPSEMSPEERPPVPSTLVPELDAGSGFRTVVGSMVFRAPLDAVVDNLTDMSHVAWLHSDSFGNQEAPGVVFDDRVEMRSDGWGVAGTFTMHNQPPNFLWDFAAVPEVRVTAEGILPNSSRIAFTLAGGVSFTTFAAASPLDDARTNVFFMLARRKEGLGSGLFDSPATDSLALASMVQVLSQDRAMLESLIPLRREMHAPSDALQLAFRKARSSFAG